MKNSWGFIATVVAAVVIVAGLAWFSASGTGEYKDSPDGRYTAHASNLRRGTWLRGRVSFIEIEIVERSTGNTVWEAERHPFAKEAPPEFGDRNQKFIVCAPDSRSVSVPVGGATDSVWVVP